MHGLSHSTKFSRIVAIDLGKFNSVVCLYDPGTTDHSFLTIQTTPRCVHDLLVQHAGEDPSQVLVVFETCDCGGWVYDIAVALGFVAAIANPSHEAWRWTKVKRKTDRDDALKLTSVPKRDSSNYSEIGPVPFSAPVPFSVPTGRGGYDLSEWHSGLSRFLR